jgi:ferredoxin
VALLARIRIQDLPLIGRGTVMDRCLSSGLPVASSCSGRGACGRCAMAILEGAEALSPPTIRERRVLKRNAHPDGSRLSCRCRVRDPEARIVVQAGYW